MREEMWLGPCPADEACVQLDASKPGNYEAMKAEADRYLELIRKVIGKEPNKAALRVKTCQHDFGEYVEVICSYDPDDANATEYAYRCEADAPTKW